MRHDQYAAAYRVQRAAHPPTASVATQTATTGGENAEWNMKFSSLLKK